MGSEEQEEKVASLIGRLGRIEAPAGFEQRVMTRIGELNAGAERRPTFLLLLKFAAPAAALLLMGALFVFFGDRGVNVTSVPPVQDGAISVAKTDNVQQTDGAGSAAGAPLTGNQNPTSRANAGRHSKRNSRSRSSIGSEDIAVEGPGETITPPGLDPRPRNIDPSTVSPNAGSKVGDVLSFVGINAACGGDGCRVTSLSKGSLAERAKLNVGDRIISIDGRVLDASSAFSSPPTFKSIQVVRDGSIINLSFTSN